MRSICGTNPVYGTNHLKGQSFAVGMEQCAEVCQTGNYTCMACQDEQHCIPFTQLNVNTCDKYACIMPNRDPNLVYANVTVTNSPEECSTIANGICNQLCDGDECTYDECLQAGYCMGQEPLLHNDTVGACGLPKNRHPTLDQGSLAICP